MGKTMDSLLILVVAVCTVLAAGITIHDANAHQLNPIPHRIAASVKSVVHWFGPISAASSDRTQSTHSRTDADVSHGTTVKSLEQQLFGQRTLVPTFGGLMP